MPALAVLLAGCRTAGYYTQAIHGQFQIVHRQERIAKVIADPQTPAALRGQLALVQDLRAFARDELKLPVDGQYDRYADLQRPYVVWNVQAAPEFSLEPKTWWYPLVGRLEYRGFFSERRAEDCAGGLAAQGYDVTVEGVEAYSTLGWFKDPVLNTFVGREEPALAEILFHELAHQRLFAPGDTDFNEAFATVAGEEGVRRWLRARGPGRVERYDAALARNRQFVLLVLNTRTRLEKLYGDARDEEGGLHASVVPHALPEVLRREKERAFEALRRDCAALKAQWGGDAGHDDWFARGLNNAKLNTVANYYELVPGFERLLELTGGSLEGFFEACRQLSKQPKEARHQRLRELAEGVQRP